RTLKVGAGQVGAVPGIAPDVEAGEIVGLLGPNGAGKTTTQRMLATLLVPTAGRATGAGGGLGRARGGAPPPPRVAEELVTQARLSGMSRPAAHARAIPRRETLDLAELGDR